MTRSIYIRWLFFVDYVFTRNGAVIDEFPRFLQENSPIYAKRMQQTGILFVLSTPWIMYGDFLTLWVKIDTMYLVSLCVLIPFKLCYESLHSGRDPRQHVSSGEFCLHTGAKITGVTADDTTSKYHRSSHTVALVYPRYLYQKSDSALREPLWRKDETITKLQSDRVSGDKALCQRNPVGRTSPEKLRGGSLHNVFKQLRLSDSAKDDSNLLIVMVSTFR